MGLRLEASSSSTTWTPLGIPNLQPMVSGLGTSWKFLDPLKSTYLGKTDKNSNLHFSSTPHIGTPIPYGWGMIPKTLTYNTPLVSGQPLSTKAQKVKFDDVIVCYGDALCHQLWPTSTKSPPTFYVLKRKFRPSLGVTPWSLTFLHQPVREKALQRLQKWTKMAKSLIKWRSQIPY